MKITQQKATELVPVNPRIGSIPQIDPLPYPSDHRPGDKYVPMIGPHGDYLKRISRTEVKNEIGKL